MFLLQSVMNRIHTISVPYAVMKACPMSWVQRVHIHKGSALAPSLSRSLCVCVCVLHTLEILCIDHSASNRHEIEISLCSSIININITIVCFLSSYSTCGPGEVPRPPLGHDGPQRPEGHQPILYTYAYCGGWSKPM